MWQYLHLLSPTSTDNIPGTLRNVLGISSPAPLNPQPNKQHKSRRKLHNLHTHAFHRPAISTKTGAELIKPQKPRFIGYPQFPPAPEFPNGTAPQDYAQPPAIAPFQGNLTGC